jgi:membrane-associated protease RseP (regulator of RpoE activity)
MSGLWYSLTVIGILGAHEMGHYVACRYYQVDASLPFFIPMLFPFNFPQTGTLGAVIRIREPFPNKAVLFDIGVAGPIAGFVILVPALIIGLLLSKVTAVAPIAGVNFGDSLLIKWASQIIWGAIPAGYTLNCHPMVFASWFGMFATALNLLPFGQLDGGHISYATFGRSSTVVSLVTLLAALGLTYHSLSWMGMTTMMVVMILLFGVRHPRVIDEHEPLGRGRKLVALCALIILVLCFMPAPLEQFELVAIP